MPTIKKEKEIFKKDLTNIATSYTYYLNKEINKINELASASLADFKKGVLEIISPANDTPAKRNFIMKLTQINTLFKAQEYVYNALLNGSGNGVI